MPRRRLSGSKISFHWNQIGLYVLGGARGDTRDRGGGGGRRSRAWGGSA